MHWNEGWHMGGMWLWWLLGIVLIVGVVWLMVRTGSSQRGSSESPEDVLKKRLAQGEISSEEYDRKLKDLRR